MTNKLAAKLFGILFIGFCVFLQAINAAPGDLDTTFAGTGFTREASIVGSDDALEATAIQTDGKIVSVGSVKYREFSSCGVTRHNSDGSLDTTFDGDGKTVIQIGAALTCPGLALQNDGKIVVVGYIQIGSIYNFAVFRFNTDGSPDASFDGDGRNVSALINADFAYGVAIQADGKIVVCGNVGDEFAVVRYNSNGSLDGTFDGDGWVVTDFYGGTDHARAIAIQTDGKIVVAGNGRAPGGSFNEFAVARYNADGSLDTGFGTGGKILSDMAGNQDNAQDIVIQTDGKIVVGGLVWGNNYKFGLIRYNSNGSLDTSFGAGGRVIAWSSTTNELYDLAIQPDGKIIAAGSEYYGFYLQLARYNENGSLDTSFDGDGILTLSVFDGWLAAKAVAIQPDGKIIAGGGTGDFALARFNSNGSVDASFDGDGKLKTNLYQRGTNASAVAIQPDGKIVAAGNRIVNPAWEPQAPNYVVHRYNPDGTFDTSFDGDGRVTINAIASLEDLVIQPDGKIIVVGDLGDLIMVRLNPNGSWDTAIYDFELDALSVVLQADGKILVAGRRYNAGDLGMSTIHRYNPDFSLDTTFDGDGKLYTNLGGNDEISSIAVQPDGKIVVAGKAETASSYDFTVMRYNGDGSLDTSFDGDGIVTIDFVGGYDYVNKLALQADGKIVVAGASSSENNLQSVFFDSALARLNSNGSLDTTFDGDGKIRVSLANFSDTATSLAIQADGKILTSGSALMSLNNDLGTLENNFALVRFNPNGSFDNTYGNNGKAIIDLFTNDLAYDIALDSSGRAVVAGESDGYFTVARFQGGAAAPNVRSPFDFDGDGKTDISIFRPSNGEWWYQRSSDGGNGAFQFGASTDKLVPADFTGDGKTDIAIWRAGEWFVLRSEDNSYYSFHFGTSGDIPVVGDFEADGKADAVVFRPSTSTWYIRRSSDGGAIIQQFGQASDVPVVADYDGDGKADIAIYRPSLGEWWIQRSTAGLIAYQFGNSTDKPTQGDFTGDGKADVAFYRPNTGEWYVLRSENLSFYSFPFGTNGDVPVPGDYDGDGRFDAAVFRPSANTWYVQRTTAGTLIQSFGQSGDVPVPSAFVP